MTTYFHGGIPGLRPGDLITPHPPNVVDGCDICAKDSRAASVLRAGSALASSRLGDHVQVVAPVEMAPGAVRLRRVDRRESVPTALLILAVGGWLKMRWVAAAAVQASQTARAIAVGVVAYVVNEQGPRQRAVFQFVQHAVCGARSVALDVDLPVTLAVEAAGPRPTVARSAFLDVPPQAGGEILPARFAVVGGISGAVPRLVVSLAISPGVTRAAAPFYRTLRLFHASIVLRFLRLEVEPKYPRGDLYTVEPVGDIEVSTEDHFPSWTVPAARVRAVYDRYVQLTTGQRRSLLRRWTAADIAALTRT